MQQGPRTEFAQALRAVASARRLDADVILETIKQAIVAAYRRDAHEEGTETEGFEFDVELDPSSGETKVFSWPEGKPEERKDVTPPGFGRIAAQTAKQVIHQKIREAEKGAIMDEFSGRINTLISGMILRFDGSDVRVDLSRSEAVMPADERIPSERLNISQRLTFLVKEIRDGAFGKQIILSRADPMFVQKLFEREVPEMSAGSVVVAGVAREAGVRTKIAVSSTQPGVDPVGSCVGQKGVRVQAVTNELNGERVDIIQFTDNTEDLIKASLAPATEASVALDTEAKTALVKVPEDQLSLAIGKDGQNARLAAKLTGWKIKIEGSGELSAAAQVEKENEEKKEATNKSIDEAKEAEVSKEAEEANVEAPTEEKVTVEANVTSETTQNDSDGKSSE
jgi:transcription termination/antitermination protein NusA